MEFGVFPPLAGDGRVISGTSWKYLPTFAFNSEVCPGSRAPQSSRSTYYRSTAVSQITVSL
jgi:hypothetical protein